MTTTRIVALILFALLSSATATRKLFSTQGGCEFDKDAIEFNKMVTATQSMEREFELLQMKSNETDKELRQRKVEVVNLKKELDSARELQTKFNQKFKKINQIQQTVSINKWSPQNAQELIDNLLQFVSKNDEIDAAAVSYNKQKSKRYLSHSRIPRRLRSRITDVVEKYQAEQTEERLFFLSSKCIAEWASRKQQILADMNSICKHRECRLKSLKYKVDLLMKDYTKKSEILQKEEIACDKLKVNHIKE